MKTMQRMLATGLLAAGALGAVGVAQARDVYWSVGVGAPGVSVGVGNAAPYYAPQPVYVSPPPVYVEPRPVYVAPPPPAYYGPPPGYYRPPRVVYRPAPGYYYGPPGGYYRHHRYDRYRDWR